MKADEANCQTPKKVLSFCALCVLKQFFSNIYIVFFIVFINILDFILVLILVQILVHLVISNFTYFI